MANADRNRRARRANGEGSVSTPRPDDGAIVIRATRPDGARVKRIVHLGTRDDGRPETATQHKNRAARLLTELVEQINETPAAFTERWTVERWARERYLPSLRTAGRKTNTMESYRKVLDMLAPYVGSIELRNLTVHDVDKLDRTLSARGLALGSRRHARGLLHRVLKHARSKGMVRYVVTSDADRLASDDRDRLRGTLQPAQVEALISTATGTPWEPYVMLLARGLRRGEVLGLSWEAIDLDAATLTVARSMVTLPGGVLELGTPKTAGSRRTVRLSPRLVAVLRAHRAAQVSNRLAAGPLWDGSFTDDAGDVVSLAFTDEAGRPTPGHRVNSALNRIAESAIGRKVNPHLLRHSAASYLYSTGMDEATIAGVLGHASAAVTRAVYAHALDDRVREGGDALDAAFGMG